ncbi:MAG: hypothetical protein JXB45_00795 [Candidatus Krumholzibacteriota bacterium]|nr:hypothetical protein [Candidatus Krumholzibacteriota bacterium]
MKSMGRSVLILFMIGTLVSAQQVSAHTVFDRQYASPELDRLVITPPDLAPAEGPGFAALAADTLETYEIALEPEKKRNIYKEIAAYSITVLFVGYMIVQLIGTGEEEEEEQKTGKNVPTSATYGAYTVFSW